MKVVHFSTLKKGSRSDDRGRDAPRVARARIDREDNKLLLAPSGIRPLFASKMKSIEMRPCW